MGGLDRDREIIEGILAEYAVLPISYGDIKREVVSDRMGDHYILMLLGRQDGRRAHGPSIHVDLIDGKFWIRYDGTERGVAPNLIDAGIPKDRIVLGFKSPELRKHTGFAVA